jgi:hypothetical protein
MPHSALSSVHGISDTQRLWTLVGVTLVSVCLFWVASAVWRAMQRRRQQRNAQRKFDEVQTRIWESHRREEKVFKLRRHKRDPWLEKIGYFKKRRWIVLVLLILVAMIYGVLTLGA